MKSNEPLEDIRTNAVSAIKWSYSYHLLSKLAPPLALLLLARHLSPNDFGDVAIALAIINLLQYFADFGLTRALIQTDIEEQSAFNIVFWANLVFGIMLFIILFFLAPLIAQLYGNIRLTTIIQVLSSMVIFNAINGFQKSILMRWMDFKKLFMITIIPNLSPLLIAVPLALSGFGVWALIIAYVFGSLIAVTIAWLYIPWRPTWAIEVDKAKSLLIFGFWVTLEALAGWFYVYGDNLIVGYYLNENDLGLYTVGYSLVVMILSLLLSPVNHIGYPAMSRIKSDNKVLASTLEDLVLLTGVIAIPVGLGIFVLAQDITQIFFDENWKRMAPVIAIIAIAQGIAFWAIAIPDAFRAKGEPSIVPKLQMIKLTYTVPIYLVGVQFGLIAFCYAKLAVVLISMSLWIWLIVKRLKVNASMLLMRLGKFAVCGVLMSIVVELVRVSFNVDSLLTAIGMLITTVLTGILIYFVLIAMLDKKMLQRILSLTRSSLMAASSK